MYLWHCHFSLWEEMDVDKEDISSVKISSLFMLNSLCFFFWRFDVVGGCKNIAVLQSLRGFFTSK